MPSSVHMLFGVPVNVELSTHVIGGCLSMLNSIHMLMGMPVNVELHTHVIEVHVNVELNTHVIGGACKCQAQYTCYLGCLSMLNSVHMLLGHAF